MVYVYEYLYPITYEPFYIGKGSDGRNPGKSTREKCRKSGKNKYHRLESKLKISNAQFGISKSIETNNKISTSLLGAENPEVLKLAKKGRIRWNQEIQTGIGTAGPLQKGNVLWAKNISQSCKEETKIKKANSGKKRLYKEDGSWVMITVEA